MNGDQCSAEKIKVERCNETGSSHEADCATFVPHGKADASIE